MKFVLISPKNRTTYNFRGDLIKDILSRGYEVIVTGPDFKEIDEIKKLGVRFELIPLKKNGINIVEDIKYLMALKSFLKREKPDVTLGYTIKPSIYGAIAAKLAGIKNINSMVTGVGYVFTATTMKAKLIRLFASLLYRIGFKCSNTIIFQNKDDKNEFVERGLVKNEKCQLVNGSGVSMEKFKFSPLPHTITFFMLSRIMYSKGIREYLEAAKIIKSKHPGAKFMLLGAIEDIQDSLSMNELKPYIDEEIIEFFGETNDVLKYYKQCSVYVLPSYREGTPRTVLEAMAVGRPIITTDAPGCRETVVEGNNGFLVPIKDSNALAEKIEWFIKNEEQITTMGQASYDICKNKFDVQKVNERMIDIMKIK